MLQAGEVFPLLEQAVAQEATMGGGHSAIQGRGWPSGVTWWSLFHSNPDASEIATYAMDQQSRLGSMHHRIIATRHSILKEIARMQNLRGS